VQAIRGRLCVGRCLPAAGGRSASGARTPVPLGAGRTAERSWYLARLLLRELGDAIPPPTALVVLRRRPTIVLLHSRSDPVAAWRALSGLLRQQARADPGAAGAAILEDLALVDE